MRFLPVFLACMAVAAPALAQDRPALYNTRNQPSSDNSLYNSQLRGGQPLSLDQITRGKNTDGYDYSRDGTGFNPHEISQYPSMADVEAFRAQRAQRAQAKEPQAMQNLANGHENLASAPVFTGAQGGTGNVYTPARKKAQRYKGRDTGVKIPPKVFNTVR